MIRALLALLLASNILLWGRSIKLEEKTNWPIVLELPKTSKTVPLINGSFYCGYEECK